MYWMPVDPMTASLQINYLFLLLPPCIDVNAWPGPDVYMQASFWSLVDDAPGTHTAVQSSVDSLCTCNALFGSCLPCFVH